jgi:hypothetical protein
MEREVHGTMEAQGRKYICTEIWWENVLEREHVEELKVDGRILLK